MLHLFLKVVNGTSSSPESVPPSASSLPINQYGPHQYASSGPLSYHFPLIKEFRGTLSPNNVLSQAEPIFENVFVGPTSIAIYKNYLYTGTAGGGIYRGDLRTGNATRILKVVNENCETKPWDVSLCGRALGIRMDSYGILYFVDAYMGLHAVEFNKDDQPTVTRLLTVDETGGKYMSHLAIDDSAGYNGGHVIYITIASTKRDLNQWPAMIIEPDRSGVVIRYDTDTKKIDTIMNGLWYPTSVELTDDRKAILVSEFTSRRIVKHFIKGPKKGMTQTWAENLPGECDHLIRSAEKSQVTYWLPIVNARNTSNPSIIDFMSDKPWLRQEILDKYQNIGESFEGLGQQWKNTRFEHLGFDLKTGNQFYTQNVANDYGMILEMDEDGKVIGSIHSVDGTNAFITEAVEAPIESPYERILYMGSFTYPYILRLVLRQRNGNDNDEIPPFVDDIRYAPDEFGYQSLRPLSFDRNDPDYQNLEDLRLPVLKAKK